VCIVAMIAGNTLLFGKTRTFAVMAVKRFTRC
jgi:hypothetical protein